MGYYKDDAGDMPAQLELFPKKLIVSSVQPVTAKEVRERIVKALKDPQLLFEFLPPPPSTPDKDKT